MTTDLGKERSQQIIDDIQLKAWNGKEELTKANTINEYHLSNLQAEDVVENARVGGNRIAFVGQEINGLSFDATNMLTALFSCDISSGDLEPVIKAYYPHVRENKVIGKSIFEMSIKEASLLLKRIAEFQQIDKDDVLRGLSGMSTKFTFFGNAMAVHEHDGASTLAEELGKLE